MDRRGEKEGKRMERKTRRMRREIGEEDRRRRERRTKKKRRWMENIRRK